MDTDPNPYDPPRTADLPPEAPVDNWNLPAISMGLAISSGVCLIGSYLMHPMHTRDGDGHRLFLQTLPWALLCPVLALFAIRIGFRRSKAFWLGVAILLIYTAWPGTWHYWAYWIYRIEDAYWR